MFTKNSNFETSKKEYKRRAKELIRISAPIVIEQVLITLMGLVNTLMLSNVGEYALSAAGMIDSISQLFIAVFAALTTGSSIIIAQYMGRDDRKKATESAAQSMIMAMGFSLVIFFLFAVFKRQILYILFNGAAEDVFEAALLYFTVINFSLPILALTQTIFSILRGSGDTGMPVIITLIMNGFNILLGYIFIFGINISFGEVLIHTKSHGVLGAGLALVFSRLVGAIIALYYITARSKIIRINKMKYFKPNMNIQKIVLGIGVPTSIESGLFNAGKLITQTFIVGMGSASIAANTVGSSIFSFVNVPGNAFAIGSMILIGQRIGREEYDDVKKTSLFSVFLGMIFLGILCIIIFPLAGSIAALYKATPEAAVYIKQLIYASCFMTTVLWPASFISISCLRATGDTKYTMIVAVASMWIFRIFFGYFFGVTMGFGVLGVWIGMYVDWLVRGIFFIHRLCSEKWRNKGIA